MENGVTQLIKWMQIIVEQSIGVNNLFYFSYSRIRRTADNGVLQFSSSQQYIYCTPNFMQL